MKNAASSSVRLLFISFSSALAFGYTAGVADACATPDIEFKLISFAVFRNPLSKTSEDFPYTAGWAGEVVNHCEEPTGVRVQILYSDKSGTVGVSSEWPAKEQNIPAGGSVRLATAFPISKGRDYDTIRMSMTAAEVHAF